MYVIHSNFTENLLQMIRMIVYLGQLYMSLT